MEELKQKEETAVPAQQFRGTDLPWEEDEAVPGLSDDEEFPGLSDDEESGTSALADMDEVLTDEDDGDGQEETEEKNTGMRTVVGVRFRTAGKSYYFAVGDLPVRRGTNVIVETSRGLEYGTSVCDPVNLERGQFRAPVKRIVRVATPADEKCVRENQDRERDACRICAEKIRMRGLEMKLIGAEIAFDRSKILFYFTSDGRVDFRDLVKDLAGVFHTRIELRQIGVRDETKILGGYGICGRPLCCHTWLTDFAPVSIKMAKEQNLSLNPTKISGSCGRLMCCLKNEEETYEELNRNMPRLGDEVEGPDGLTGEVAGVNILKQTVRVLIEVDDEKELHEYGAGEITILRRRKRGQAKPKINRSELRDPKASRAAGKRQMSGKQERSERTEKEPLPQTPPEHAGDKEGAERCGRERGKTAETGRAGRGRQRRPGRPKDGTAPEMTREGRERVSVAPMEERPSAGERPAQSSADGAGPLTAGNSAARGHRHRSRRRGTGRGNNNQGNDRTRESTAPETE